MGLVVGVALGLVHFVLFTWSVGFVMAGRAGAATVLALATLVLRHLLLGMLFIGAWKAGGVDPRPMGVGLVASWMGLRALLAARGRMRSG